ncbi:MAG: DEAD/DEAH box helicase [Phycisphaerales bacterium]|nr:DEAD/DEAH box helicase [Phycisphaerales bacterium]
MTVASPTSNIITLRPYQKEAVEAVYAHLRGRDDNPCVVLPTAAGKTPCIATICRDVVHLWNGRVLVLAHVKELLSQAVDKLHAMAPDLWMNIGVYSAGLAKRDTTQPILVAGIQSVYQKAKELGRFDLVIVDEAHLIPMEGDGMYRRFLDDARSLNPQLRVIGLTATPFRLSSGPICVPPPEGILNSICYEIGVRELIAAGYISKLKSKSGKFKANTDGLHVRGGEFVPAEVEALMDQDGLVHAACKEIVELTKDRRSVLIFASSVKHGQHVAKTIERIAGEECGFVDGETSGIFRDQILRRFHEGELKFLANVNVLTTGFDAPNVDCVVLLRPTMSPGLYYQMVGRGFRLAPGKADCLVLDFSGNVLRHGPVDQIRVHDPAAKRFGSQERPSKECPSCQALIATGYATCPECGFVFPPPERDRHEAEAGTAGVLSGEITDTEYEVRDVHYSVHVKRDATYDAPRTLRVDYEIGYYQYKTEWVCLEHKGYARQKAEAWWRMRSCTPVPKTIEEAVALAKSGVLAQALAITVRHVAGEKFDRIIDCVLVTKPELETVAVPDAPDESWDESLPLPMQPEDEIPF